MNCDIKINLVNPQRIREARIARGMSIGELAEKLDISRQAVSQFELGKIKPDPSRMMEISNILKLPISYFNRPIERNQYSVSSLKYRANAGMPIKIQEACGIHLSWIYDIYKVLDKSIEFPNVNLFVKNDTVYDENQIEEIASELRVLWGLGMGPIDNLVEVVQSNGILIGGLNLKSSSKIYAFSEWVEEVPIIVLGEVATSTVRQRFTIAHELGHLILHAYADDEEISKEAKKRMEKEADRFASAFLMPEQSFSQDIYSTRLDSFLTLKKKWKTSIQSIAYRCKDLGLISEEQYTYMAKRISMNGWRTNEPLDDEWNLERPYLLSSAIELLLNNIYSPSEIVSSLMLERNEIEKICFLPKNFLKGESKVVPLTLKTRDDLK